MFRAGQEVETEANRTGSRFRRLPRGSERITPALDPSLLQRLFCLPAATTTLLQRPSPQQSWPQIPRPPQLPSVAATPEPTATPAPTATPTATPEPEPVNEDDALTRAYVEKAIAYYDANGRDATIEYYKSMKRASREAGICT